MILFQDSATPQRGVFNVETGALRWAVPDFCQNDGNQPCQYFAATTHRPVFLAINGSTNVIAFSPSNGTVLWSYPSTGNGGSLHVAGVVPGTEGTPLMWIVLNDWASGQWSMKQVNALGGDFVGPEIPSNCSSTEARVVRNPGKDGGYFLLLSLYGSNVTAFDLDDSTFLWTTQGFDDSSSVFKISTIADESRAILHDGLRAFAVDIATGAIIWRQRLCGENSLGACQSGFLPLEGTSLLFAARMESTNMNSFFNQSLFLFNFSASYKPREVEEDSFLVWSRNVTQGNYNEQPMIFPGYWQYAPGSPAVVYWATGGLGDNNSALIGVRIADGSEAYRVPVMAQLPMFGDSQPCPMSQFGSPSEDVFWLDSQVGVNVTNILRIDSATGRVVYRLPTYSEFSNLKNANGVCMQTLFAEKGTIRDSGDVRLRSNSEPRGESSTAWGVLVIQSSTECEWYGIRV